MRRGAPVPTVRYRIVGESGCRRPATHIEGDPVVCRLLGWSTRTPTSLHRLLGHDDLADFTELSGLHGDGWGLARRVAGGVEGRKRPNAARMSDDYTLWSRATRSDLGLVHLRRATLGLPVRMENTHPFTDGRMAFAHNGSIFPPPALDALLSPAARARRAGETDSERYFLAVLSQLEAGATPAEALREAVAGIAATASFTSLNCLLLTPEELYAVCFFDPDGRQSDEAPDYYHLRYRATDDAAVITSSGWGRGWHDLANGDLLVVRRGTPEVTVESLRGDLIRT
jgi:predicted glutamine amidotransferase